METHATPSIEYPYQVMFFDTDCAAVVHNLAYLRIIETARTMLAEQLGFDMPTHECPVITTTIVIGCNLMVAKD